MLNPKVWRQGAIFQSRRPCLECMLDAALLWLYLYFMYNFMITNSNDLILDEFSSEEIGI